MLTQVFATKLGMSQAWTTQGKRLAVTRCRIDQMVIVGEHKNSATASQTSDAPSQTILEIGYGSKKLNNMGKPMKTRLEKAGLTHGVKYIEGVKTAADEAPSLGASIKVEEILSIGDVVKVQGTTKGRGFAGAMKRHGFSGGPKTHGQSDRSRAVGSIGAGTTPGRVWKGKRMPGRYGNDTQTVSGLIVVHIDPSNQEIWLSGPVPGATSGFVRITKTGTTKDVSLNKAASGIAEVVAQEVETPAVEAEVQA